MKTCIIGGGAAGMMSAIILARGGADVVLLEKNEKTGKKLYITGKGRCNVTNDCGVDEVFANIVNGKKFLRSAVYSFTPQDTMRFFEELGVKLVTERGNRVFPLSQKSSDIIRALDREMHSLGVDVRTDTTVTDVKKCSYGFEILTETVSVFADSVIVATGGVSYPSTGSTGDGYAFAKTLGLDVVEPRQALAPVLVAQNVSALQGISLKNVCLSAFDKNGKLIVSEFGEMLFTNRGLSGPIALTQSSYINRMDGVYLLLDLKPALDESTLEQRILRDFDERKNLDLKNATRSLMPQRLNSFVLAQAGLQESKKVNSVTKEERKRLVDKIKNLRFDVSGLAPFNEAIITSGGVSLNCLKPSCECKNTEGLYFVGETIDIDALTGGFNLQIAFSTAVAAAKDILKKQQKV